MKLLGLFLVSVAAFASTLVSCDKQNRAPAFDLLDDRGRPWQLQAQVGATVLLFGFTHCQDTCPLMLAKLSKALNGHDLRTVPITVVFVTVDPQRDSPAVLRAYLSKFGPHFVGLTGTPSQIDSVERSYHVWAQKLPSRNRGYEYDEAHDSTMFFIDSNRNLVSLHDPTDSVNELVDAMRQL